MTTQEKNSFRSFLSSPFFPPVFLLLICLAAYLPSIFNGFKLDDFTYINPDMHQKTASVLDLFIKSTNQHYNPLNILLNDLFFSWWGKNVVPFHLLNMTLFYVNVLLLYRICFLFTAKEFTALIAAVLFCLHPINAEIVNQIVFNTVLIAAAFLQLSFLAFDRHLQTQSKRYLCLSVGSATIAFLTLETSWVLPFYLLMWALRDRPFKDALRVTAFFWGIVVGLFVIWYLLSQGNKVDAGFVQKLTYLDLSVVTLMGSLSYLVSWYLQKLFIPVDHIWIYSIHPLSIAGSVKYLMIAGAVTVLVLVFARKILLNYRVIAIGSIWFLSGFVFLLPGSLTHPDTGLVIEPYWFYVSSMGFFMICAILLTALKENYSRCIAYAVIFFICLGLWTYTQKINRIANSERSYSEYWMKISPNPVPVTALAKIAYEHGDRRKALEYYEIYLKEFGSSAYAPYQADELYASIGGLYAEMGQPAKAKDFLSRSLQINRANARAHRLMASVHVNEQDYVSAEVQLIEAIQLGTNPLLDKINLADLYLITKQDLKAIPILKDLTASKVKGNDRRNVFAKLAVLHLIYNGPEASQETISRLIAIDPDPMSFIVLAQAFTAFQKNEQAIAILRRGLEQYPSIREFEDMIAKLRSQEK